MSIASCFLHFAVQCFYLQFRPQSSTGNEDVFPLPVTAVSPHPSSLIIMSMEKFSSSKSSLLHWVQMPNERCDCDAVAMTTSFLCVFTFIFGPYLRPIPPFMITWYSVPFELTDKRWEERLTRILLFICQVRLLKDILEAWKKEVEKKPSDLTLDEAYETLKVKKDPSG